MVHLRINEREPNPNKHINFISALPAPQVPAPYSEEDAKQLLRALAAQVRPVMKSHGFAVNSFEEYEYNRVFAGRNWNNGETIELVLRRADGTFVSVPWLLGTLCHELAHIKHMNHGRDFQRLWTKLRMEVRALQERGYFGDGYWSSGTRVSDSIRIGGQGVEDYDLPEYVCGGAQSRSHPSSLSHRRSLLRRPRSSRTTARGPSHHTGPQVEKRRKPGTRVRAKNAFRGEGKALNDGISDDEERARGTGFRKQAGSKRAREERALAAERRLKALKGIQSKTEPTNRPPADEDGESDSEYDADIFPEPAEKETDESRRKTMQDALKPNEEDEGEDEEMNSSQRFMRDFLSKVNWSKDRADVKDGDFKKVFEAIEISDSDSDTDDGGEEGEEGCDIPSMSNPVISRPSNSNEGDDSRAAKRPRTSPSPSTASVAGPSRPSTSAKPLGKWKGTTIGIGRIVEEEMKTRKREALGLVGERKLGGAPASTSGSGSRMNGNSGKRDRTILPIESKTSRSVEEDQGIVKKRNDGLEWACLVCTLDNQPTHLACSACGTPRGESSWPHS